MSFVRAAARLSLLVAACSSPAFADDMPTITTSGGARSVTLRVDPIPVRDGEKNVVGTISGMAVTVVEAQGQKTHFSIDYKFYNGSGTWRGSQTVNVDFKNAQNGTLTEVTFPLERGHCVYGQPEARHVEGAMESVIGLIQHVEVTVTPVSGVQTRC